MLVVYWPAEQKNLQQTVARVENNNDKNFSILGHQIKAKEDSVQNITTAVVGQLKILQADLLDDNGAMAALSKSNIHLTQDTISAQQIREHTEDLGTLLMSNLTALYFLRMKKPPFPVCCH